MNYRHAFHAGNFADLLKHAILTRSLAALTVDRAPLTVIDTHAGAGLYDLAGDAGRATGEGQAGIGRLMAATDAPSVFDPLRAAVKRANPPGLVRFYPGSPLLLAETLRPRDQLLACELRPDDHAALKAVLPRQVDAEVLAADGWTTAVQRAPPAPARLLVLIDPPYERGDDHRQAASLTSALLARNPEAVIVIWSPIKDLASFDAFLETLEDAVGAHPLLLAQTRLRALTDPMLLNGCAVAVVNPPTGLQGECDQATSWIATVLGEADAVGRVTWIVP
jgi:23S rRNA (adenine2030-N6)-methyltransferase